MMNPLYIFQQLLGRKSKVLTALGIFLLSTSLNYMYIMPVLFIYTVSERSYGQTITKRQQQVLEMIKDHIEESGYPPTRVDISQKLGV